MPTEGNQRRLGSTFVLLRILPDFSENGRTFSEDDSKIYEDLRRSTNITEYSR